MRSGVIAQKVGMTRVFTDAGEQVGVTVLKLDNLQVVAQRTAEKNGYTAVQLGAGLRKVKNTPKALRGHFARAEVEPKREVAEFRVSPENLIDIGAELTADHFVVGQFVDVTGTSIGRGFQGVIKRHHFGGGRATHGNSVSHRTHGSTGQRQDPGKVFKAEAYILTKEEGGRHTPFFTNYRPQFYFRTTDVTGVVQLPEGTEMVMPGDNVSMTVELIVPIAMEERLRFAIREGGRTVGSGVVASIVK